MVHEKMAHLISIIIPCYNQGRYLSEAVESVLSQDYRDKEIIVVNDGSTDMTGEQAAAFGDRITYIEQTNKGVSAARNAGIAASRGDYIAYLDSDDVLLPESLSLRASFLDGRPDRDMVCGEALTFDENGITGLKSALAGMPACKDDFRWETVGYCATMSTVMLRRTCHDKAGLFDEHLRDAAEDWLMGVQLSLHCTMAYLDRPLASYRIHRDSASHATERINNGLRYALRKVVDSDIFMAYPPSYRARLLFFCSATTVRFGPRCAAAFLVARALMTDPRQIPFGVAVFSRGTRNTWKRLRRKQT